MAFLEKSLYVKKSTIPGSGKGLFTKVLIPKGTRIIEYKGEKVTWKEVEQMADDRNGYVFYFNSKYCLDAWNTKTSLARYINDAKGIVKIEGVKNNTEYVIDKKKCFVEATRDIPKGSELFVGYGGEYWQAIRYNIRLEQRRKERAGKAGEKVELPHDKMAKRKRAKK